MEWSQNDKCNWQCVTPSGTSITVFRRDDRWSWSATRKYQDAPVYSETQWDDPGEAKQDIESRCAPEESKVIPEAPLDYFNYEQGYVEL